MAQWIITERDKNRKKNHNVVTFIVDYDNVILSSVMTHSLNS